MNIFIEMAIPINELIVDKRLINKVKNIFKNKKTLLLIGPTGIGKTCLINSIAESLNFKLTNIDPENDFKRNKKNFFIKNEAILIDNIEEIKGKLLIQIIEHFINDTRPLILISSEIHTDLLKIKTKYKIRATNYLGFSLPDWLEYLSKKYNLDKKILKKMLKITKYNRGIALNQIKFGFIKINEKDITKNISVYEGQENIFNKNIDRTGYYFNDNNLPIFIYENFPKLKNNNIEYCSNTLSALTQIDELETFYKKRQYYEFMPYVDIMTTQMATYNYNKKFEYTKFPEYYGKIKQKKNNLLLETFI